MSTKIYTRTTAQGDYIFLKPLLSWRVEYTPNQQHFIMFSISAFSAASRRVLARQIISQSQKRGMALGGAKVPPPKWEGLDKIVRSYFPEDHQG